MKRALARVLLVLVGVAVVLAVGVATRPGEFAVSRSTLIAAPATDVFVHVNDLRNWQAWSPWAKRDPQMKQAYAGPVAGVGAEASWQGNREVGAGRMTIVESRPQELVRFRLEFFEPFAATHSAEFRFEQQGSSTLVTWTMRGTNGFVGKAMGLVFDIDAMIGADFEQGLAGIKQIAEGGPK